MMYSNKVEYLHILLIQSILKLVFRLSYVNFPRIRKIKESKVLSRVIS